MLVLSGAAIFYYGILVGENISSEKKHYPEMMYGKFKYSGTLQIVIFFAILLISIIARFFVVHNQSLIKFQDQKVLTDADIANFESKKFDPSTAVLDECFNKCIDLGTSIHDCTKICS